MPGAGVGVARIRQRSKLCTRFCETDIASPGTMGIHPERSSDEKNLSGENAIYFGGSAHDRCSPEDDGMPAPLF